MTEATIMPLPRFRIRTLMKTVVVLGALYYSILVPAQDEGSAGVLVAAVLGALFGWFGLCKGLPAAPNARPPE